MLHAVLLNISFSGSAAPEQCPVAVAITFLVDTSSNVISPQNFEKQKVLVQRIASRFNVTNVGGIKIIPYSDKPHEDNVFSVQQGKTFGEFAEQMRDLHFLMGGCSRYDLALNKGYNEFQSLGGPSNSQRVLVLLASGKQPQYPRMTPAYVQIKKTSALLREAKILTYAVGIGNGVRSSDLKIIATDPSKVFMFESFENLTEGDIYKDICKSSGEL